MTDSPIALGPHDTCTWPPLIHGTLTNGPRCNRRNERKMLPCESLNCIERPRQAPTQTNQQNNDAHNYIHILHTGHLHIGSDSAYSLVVSEIGDYTMTIVIRHHIAHKYQL